MDAHDAWTLGTIVVVALLVTAWVVSAQLHERAHPSKRRAGGVSAGMIDLLEEVFHPAKYETTRLQQVEAGLPAPAPLAGGPVNLEEGRITVTIPPAKIRVSAALMLDERGRLLVVRKHGTSVFMQPGGKPEPGEDPEATLIRELAEEVGVLVSPADLRALGEFQAPAANEAGHTVVAEVFEVVGTHSVSARGEIAEARWISAAEARELGSTLAPLTANFFLDRLS